MLHFPKASAIAIALTFASICHAETGKVDQEAAEMAAELIGAPVFAADGPEIGEVADISFDDEGRPQRLRIVAAAILGLGARTSEIPRGSFTALRGAVVLDLPADAVKTLPELPEAPGDDD